MKPREKKPDIVYRVISRASGEACGAYSRAYCDEFDFTSPSEARSSMFSGEYQDKSRFKIAKYRVTYELIEDDCDVPPKDCSR